MHALRYHESIRRGSPEFPLDYHYIDEHHSRYQMPYHWHDEVEILHVISGALHLSIGEDDYLLGANDVAFVASGRLHGGQPDHCVYECVVFDMRLLLKSDDTCRQAVSRILDGRITLSACLPGGSPATLHSILPMFAALRGHYPGENLITLGCLYQFLGQALASGAYTEHPAPAAAENRRQRKLKKVFELIESEYAEPLTLTRLAEPIGMTPRYFCRFFREATHFTPLEYLGYYRVEMACYSFAATERSVTDVALDVGYEDVNYFIRCFKKYKGVTPGAYRRALLGEAG